MDGTSKTCANRWSSTCLGFLWMTAFILVASGSSGRYELTMEEEIYAFSPKSSSSVPKSDVTRCGTREWSLEEILRDKDRMKAYQKPERLEAMRERKAFVIETYVHVIYKTDGTGYVDGKMLEKQIEILNDAFSGKAAMYPECTTKGNDNTPAFIYDDNQRWDSAFRFNFVSADYVQNNEAHDASTSAYITLRKSLRKGNCTDLNVFVAQHSYLGLATYPDKCRSTDNNLSGDGVFIHYRSLPDYQGPPDFHPQYNQGDTLVHEVGHWLGLHHTFKGGCSDENDSVEDTPAESEASFSCPIGRDTCYADGFDPIHNFMDYTDDCCMYTFTPDQIARMKAQFIEYREAGVFEQNTLRSSDRPSLNGTEVSTTGIPTTGIPPTGNPTLVFLKTDDCVHCPFSTVKCFFLFVIMQLVDWISALLCFKWF